MELTENVPKLPAYPCQLELHKEPQKETLPSSQPVQKSHRGESACLVAPAFLVSQGKSTASAASTPAPPECCFTGRARIQQGLGRATTDKVPGGD